MLNWVGLVSGIVKLFNAVSRYIERKDNIKAGRNEVLNEMHTEQDRRRKRVNTARLTDPISMSDDPNNRAR